MVEIPFGTLVREARAKAGLTLAFVASIESEVSALELRKRPASAEEAERLTRVLGLDSCRVNYATRETLGNERELLAAARKLLSSEPYFPVGQTAPHAAFRTAFAADAGDERAHDSTRAPTRTSSRACLSGSATTRGTRH